MRGRAQPLTPAVARLCIQQRTQPEGECLVWTGNIDVHGYPRLNLGGKLFLVHRLVRAMADGASYAGLHVHHKCRKKACVRLEHLEVLTPSEHSTEHQAGKTECPRGHSLADAYDRPDGKGRQCRQCILIRSGWQTERNRARRVPPSERLCIQCHRPFVPVRQSTARYCGQSCRKDAYLVRHPFYWRKAPA